MTQETSAAAEPPERPPAANPPTPVEPASAPAPANLTASTPVEAVQPEIVATPATPVTTTMPASAASDPVPVTTAMEPAPGDTPPPPPAAPARASQGLPPWLPMFALAVVPAVIVGVIVFALAGSGGSGGSKSVGGVLDFFFRQGSSPENVLSFEGKAPPNFPTDFPVYSGADVYAGFQIIPEEGNGASFYVIYGTSDSIDDVYTSYLNAFNGDTWAVEIARSSDDFTGVRFTRPDDPDVSGDVTLHRSELDNRTTIFVTFQDLTPSQAVQPADRDFVLKPSRPLPTNFPSSDIPIYDSKNGESVITDTYIEKAPGGTSYVISFLTKDSQDDVIESYSEAFKGKGWVVEDAENDAQTNFQVGITFTDGPAQTIQGTVLTDAFEDDTSYTKVDVLVQVTSGRRSGN